ncbi:MAG: DUF1997 domain-containing protein [Spirulinaceae cyanobacterium SM2_1_0]|nr:DUF1997 domain-containing protein [Spirulinaceae cyanobacterium SM2_1_0]
MQSYVDEYQLNVDSELPIEVEQALQAANDPDMMPDQPLPVAAEEIFTFEARFKGQMVMHSPAQAVADYLSTHEDWFPACAQPMHAEPLGENGYVLTIGSFGAFGYEVEPKMGVVLQPPAAGVYHMHSIPVPDYTPPGYEVDYQAAMHLRALDRRAVPWAIAANIGEEIARLEWQLQLGVTIRFPHFIYHLPRHLIQTTGDRLLCQIVRQISPRLTYKVQKDFHARHNLQLPPRRSRQLVLDSDTARVEPPPRQ